MDGTPSAEQAGAGGGGVDCRLAASTRNVLFPPNEGNRNEGSSEPMGRERSVGAIGWRRWVSPSGSLPASPGGRGGYCAQEGGRDTRRASWASWASLGEFGAPGGEASCGGEGEGPAGGPTDRFAGPTVRRPSKRRQPPIEGPTDRLTDRLSRGADRPVRPTDRLMGKGEREGPWRGGRPPAAGTAGAPPWWRRRGGDGEGAGRRGPANTPPPLSTSTDLPQPTLPPAPPATARGGMVHGSGVRNGGAPLPRPPPLPPPLPHPSRRTASNWRPSWSSFS